MNTTMRLLSSAAGLAVVAALAGCDGGAMDDGQTLTMGVVPTDTVEETFDQWSEVIERLEEETGYEIELYEATDLAAVVESTIAGDLDIVHLGPFGQMIAHENGAEITTVGATAPTSAGVNNASVALVRDDSSSQTIADLNGEDVCFISPSSTTGYLFGAKAMLDEGIDPDADINPIFVGDHASAVRTMYDGECEAVFTYRDYGERIVYEDNTDIAEGEIRTLWQEEVPEAGLAISTELPDETQAELRDALLGINGTSELEGCDPENIIDPPDGSGEFCGAIWPNDGWGLVEKDDSYWEPIREVCEATDAPACAG